MEPLLAMSGVLLHWSLPPDPLLVDLSPFGIELVFASLLEDARQATPPGGWVRIVVRRAGGWVMAVVSDSRESEMTGSGWGLPQVRRILGEAGGQLELHGLARSTVRFTVFLPGA